MDRVGIPRDSSHSCNSRTEQLYGILTKNNFDIVYCLVRTDVVRACLTAFTQLQPSWERTVFGFSSVGRDRDDHTEGSSMPLFGGPHRVHGPSQQSGDSADTS